MRVEIEVERGVGESRLDFRSLPAANSLDIIGGCERVGLSHDLSIVSRNEQLQRNYFSSDSV